MQIASHISEEENESDGVPLSQDSDKWVNYLIHENENTSK